MSIIVAGFTGIGKTTLSEQYPDVILDLIPTPFKYNFESGTVCTEATKANHDWELSDEWPHNYVEKIREAMGTYAFIMIAPDMVVLELLRRRGVPYVLAYPERCCKAEYRTRFIRRGNAEEFLDIFIDGWDRFMDSYEQTHCTVRLTLRPGEYLTIERLREIESTFPKTMIDLGAVYSVTREELAKRFDHILELVELGYSPVLIKADGKPDLLLFCWDDYMERFSDLYSQAEIDTILKLCKDCSDDGSL